MPDIYEDGPAEANRTRAYWALSAVETFAQSTGQCVDPGIDQDEHVIREVVGDLVSAYT